MIRILFTGGGTGGHIYPIIAVTEELQKISVEKNIEIELRYFGAPGFFGPLLQQNGIRVSKILSAKLRRYFDVRNFIDIPILLPLSIIQSLFKIFWLMPDVLFSKGGPGSLPVVLAAKFYRVPIIIHDSDALMGLANQLALRFSDRIAVSFESIFKTLASEPKLAEKIALTGNPVRPSLIAKDVLDSATAKRTFGFVPEKSMILVMGGSQGAVKINDFMLEIAGELLKDYQILHQVGMKNFEQFKRELDIILKNLPEEEKKRYKSFAYFEKDLKVAYSAADVVICRAGSLSIFEIAAFGKPSILIPLPSDVVGDHQIKNAYEYAEGGAAVVIEEENLQPNIFMSQLKKLFTEPDALVKMSESAKAFSKPEAAKVLAEEIINLGK